MAKSMLRNISFFGLKDKAFPPPQKTPAPQGGASKGVSHHMRLLKQFLSTNERELSRINGSFDAYE
jgi:hypothetical protein